MSALQPPHQTCRKIRLCASHASGSSTAVWGHKRVPCHWTVYRREAPQVFVLRDCVVRNQVWPTARRPGEGVSTSQRQNAAGPASLGRVDALLPLGRTQHLCVTRELGSDDTPTAGASCSPSSCSVGEADTWCMDPISLPMPIPNRSVHQRTAAWEAAVVPRSDAAIKSSDPVSRPSW